jgi:uncharacterized protein (DUF1330 family)
MSSPLSNAFNELRYSIKDINLYQSPYKHPNVGKITDEFGSIEVISSGSYNNVTKTHASRSFVVDTKSKRNSLNIYGIPQMADYINFRYGNSQRNVTLDNTVFPNGTVDSGKVQIGVICAPSTFILPKFFNGAISFYANTWIFRRGIYLNSSGTKVASSESWILNTASIDSNTPFAVVDFDSGRKITPLYLNRLYLAAKTFDNLANKLGTVTNGKLYLGSKNIANMTTTQKNAITAKGWTIY